MRLCLRKGVRLTIISTAHDGDKFSEDGVSAEPIDEAALIEQRRKRREAIKAKYRGQATPLLVQALQIGPETGSSISDVSEDISKTNASGISLQSPHV